MRVHTLAPDLTIYEGHVIESLRAMPPRSVHCSPTSDPYWGLRDYAGDRWEGGDPECDHAVRTPSTVAKQIRSSTLSGGKKTVGHQQEGYSETCPRCGAKRADIQVQDWPEITFTPAPGLPPMTVPAWRGAYGLEPDPWMYIAHLVYIRREIWRVLRDDATHWMNLGASWNGSGGAGGDYGPGGLKEGQPKYPGRRAEGFKAKDMVPIPWMAAMALQADGWYLRIDNIWSKPNPMPESVTDRCTKAHEYIFLLTKSQRYYYDWAGIRELAVGQNPHDLTGGKYAPPGQTPHTGSRPPKSATFKRDNSKRATVIPNQTVGTHRPDREDRWPTGYRNKRSVWEIATVPFPEAHFATFPPELPKVCILAGTSPKACPTCGAPWERVIEKVPVESPSSYNGSTFTKGKTAATKPNVGKRQRHETVVTDRFQPGCQCEGNDGSGKCIVLDPFHGSGTTSLVARAHGRAAIGCELNPEYVEISKRRLLTPVDMMLLETAATQESEGPKQMNLLDQLTGSE